MRGEEASCDGCEGGGRHHVRGEEASCDGYEGGGGDTVLGLL